MTRIGAVQHHAEQRPGLGLRGHMPVLDGLRGWAILLVLFHHFFQTADHANPAMRAMFRVLGAGWYGVDLFFVLSGFLITGILLDAKETEHYFRNFYMRRVLRIFPLYYLALALVLVVIPALSPGFREANPKIMEHQGWLWLYTSNFWIALHNDWVMTGPSLEMNHFWTLAVEEQFYLVWPAVVWAASRRGVMKSCVACFVGAMAVRGVMVWMGAGDVAINVLTFARFDSLAMGAFWAALVRGNVGTRGITRGAMAATGAGLAVVAVMVARRGTMSHDDVPFQLAVYTALALLFGGVLVLAVGHPLNGTVRRLLGNRVVLFFGKYSYGLYVLHNLFGPLFHERLAPERLKTTVGSYTAACFLVAAVWLGLSVATAWLSWQLYERQFLKLKAWFDYERGAAGNGGTRDVPVMGRVEEEAA